MPSGGVERRRGQRASVQAPVVIRRLGPSGPGPTKEETATNVSLAGVYFETEDDQVYGMNEIVLTSIAIPPTQTRNFPFTRLAGRGRVVRVKESSGEGSSGTKRFGVALEFGEDLTALTALPSR